MLLAVLDRDKTPITVEIKVATIKAAVEACGGSECWSGLLVRLVLVHWDSPLFQIPVSQSIVIQTENRTAQCCSGHSVKYTPCCGQWLTVNCNLESSSGITPFVRLPQSWTVWHHHMLIVIKA